MSKRIYLRAFEMEDYSFINALRNDEYMYEFTCGNKYFVSQEREKEWVSDKIFDNVNQLYLMICTLDDDGPIGYISATNIDYINRKAQWGGIVISHEFSGKGYGTESAVLLLQHLFHEVNMNMVYGFWREDHIASLRMAEKLGFKKDGLIRDYVFKQNKYHNAYVLTILKSEFETVHRQY